MLPPPRFTSRLATTAPYWRGRLGEKQPTGKGAMAEGVELTQVCCEPVARRGGPVCAQIDPVSACLPACLPACLSVCPPVVCPVRLVCPVRPCLSCLPCLGQTMLPAWQPAGRRYRQADKVHLDQVVVDRGSRPIIDMGSNYTNRQTDRQTDMQESRQAH